MGVIKSIRKHRRRKSKMQHDIEQHVSISALTDCIQSEKQQLVALYSKRLYPEDLWILRELYLTSPTPVYHLMQRAAENIPVLDCLNRLCLLGLLYRPTKALVAFDPTIFRSHGFAQSAAHFAKLDPWTPQ